MTCPESPFDLTGIVPVRSSTEPDRNSPGQDRSGAPIHAQTPDRNRSGQVRSGRIGHLTALTAAYKRSAGDRSPDSTDIEARLAIAEATNRVLTELIYQLVGEQA